MNWLARLFATKRELWRMAREVKTLRRALAAAELDKKLLLARNDLLVDRMLTAQVKTYAIADEARRVTDPQVKAQEKREYNSMLEGFLSEERARLVGDAIEAGRDPSDGETLFNRRKADLTEEFNSQFGFSN